MPVTDQGVALLIDGHSIAFRAFYGLPAENFMTSTGQYTNAVYGFTSMLANLITSTHPTHIGVAFDLSRVSFRTGQYPDYKGTRGETPEPFFGQTELIHEVLHAAGIAHVEVPNFEADDVIATWARQAEAAGLRALICSGDRDLLQMVTETTTVLYPVKGVTEMASMTPQAVEDKYGVVPGQYPELAALVGEASDNLPGVPGVGAKTAAKWLTQFGDLDELLVRADQVPGKVGESLRQHLDDVRRNRQLNALVTTLDLPIGVDALMRQAPDAVEITRLFGALEFGTTLRTRFMDALGQPDVPMPVSREAQSRVVETAGDVAAWIGHNTAAETPTAVLVKVDEVWLAGPTAVTGITRAGAGEAALADWLADATYPKTMHAAKGQIQALAAQGWPVNGLTMDTELAAYLLQPDQRSFDLEGLSVQYLGRPLSGAAEQPAQQAMLNFDEVDEDSPARVAAVADLAAVLQVALDRDGESDLLRDVELPVQKVLATMETTGVAADEAVLGRLRDDLDAAVVEAEKQAFRIIGHDFNMGSTKQLQVILFDELKMPKTKKTKLGYTTDAAALEGLYAATEHPFLEQLLIHRDNIKLRQMVDSLIRSVADDSRIHTTYQQTAAATGRLSSTDPNLQNIPIRTETGKRVREAFVAGNGYEALLSADYSQIEMRVMAHVSGDPALIEAFCSGVDFHTVTASRVFGVPADQVTPAQRSRVKQVNYGLAYGLSAYGLSTRLGISVGDARDLMNDYFSTFGHVREYLDDVVVKARRVGYTQTLLGRRRYLPDLTSLNGQRREMAERAALNAPIQGTAADIIKLAMVRVAAELASQGLASRLLLQVHDELVFEVGPGEQSALSDLVTDVMTHAMDLAVPLDVSIGVGDSWASAH